MWWPKAVDSLNSQFTTVGSAINCLLKRAFQIFHSSCNYPSFRQCMARHIQFRCEAESKKKLNCLSFWLGKLSKWKRVRETGRGEREKRQSIPLNQLPSFSATKSSSISIWAHIYNIAIDATIIFISALNTKINEPSMHHHKNGAINITSGSEI